MDRGFSRNALSELARKLKFQKKQVYKQRYERGKVVRKLEVIGECEKKYLEQGYIFPGWIDLENDLDYNVLNSVSAKMAFLTKGLKIVLRDETGGRACDRNSL